MSASQQSSTSILHDLLNECNASAKRQYNHFVSGTAGNEIEEDIKIYGEILATIKTCITFEQLHEKDRFRTGVDINYIGDDAYPDSQQHTNWQYSQKYDDKKNQYDIVRAQNAFKRALRARRAGA